MKVLNLDAFVIPKRVLVLDGIRHPIVELTVGGFIENLAAAEALEAETAKEDPVAAAAVSPFTDLAKQVQRSIDSIRESIPTLEEARMRQLPLESIGAVLKFIRGEFDEQALATVTPEQEGAEKKPT